MGEITIHTHGTPSLGVSDYLENALSESSRLAYKKDFHHFRIWGGAFPSRPEDISRYLSEHAGLLSISTLQRRLVSIGKAHVMAGYPSPTKSELVKMTMRGVRRVHGCPQKQVNPVMRDDLVAMLNHIPDTLKGKRDRALLLLGFCGAFRRSEIIALRCTDLDFRSEGLIVSLTRSKTDQNGVGRQIGIPRGRGKICPVKAIEDWLVHLSANQGALFRSVKKSGSKLGETLSDRAVANIVKSYVEKAGLDPSKYSGHSLRAGLCSSAAQHGYSSWVIRKQSGHKSDSTLYRYIRIGDLFTDNAAALF